jgi:parvulin-like peptidyl-prolyl isomerase
LNLFQYYQQFGMDVSQQVQQVTMQLQSPDILGQQVLDQMIDEALIRQEAEKRGITVTDDEVEKAIQESNGFFSAGTPTPTITPTEFSTPTLSPDQLAIYPSTSTPTEVPTSTAVPTNTPDRSATATATSTAALPTPTFVPEAATATATPYTFEGFQADFKKALKDYKSYGISEATLRSVYKNDLLRRKLLDEIAKDTPRTEEQAWARHILVDSAGIAKTVEALLAHGTDFADAAKEFSKDTGSGVNGGDLGWFGKGAMVPEFEQAVFSQDIGAIGEPVQSQFGYHIVQVIDRQERPLTADQYQQKRDSIFTEWLTARRKDGTDAETIKTFDIWKERVPSEPAALNTPTP